MLTELVVAGVIYLVGKAASTLDHKLFSEARPEDYILKNTDFFDIIEKLAKFKEIPKFDAKTKKNINCFFKINAAATLIVQKIFIISYPGETLETLKNEFCDNLVASVDDDKQNLQQFADAFFKVLCEGCVITLEKASNKGDSNAKEYLRILFQRIETDKILNKVESDGIKNRLFVDKKFDEYFDKLTRTKEESLEKEELDKQIEKQLEYIIDTCSIFQIPNISNEISTADIVIPRPTISNRTDQQILGLNDSGETRADISSLVKKEKHLVLIGEAGSGKSTALRWLAQEYARNHRKGVSNIIPVYINLNRCTESCSFENYITTYCEFTEEALNILSEQGKIFYLFDGLDTYSGNIAEINRLLKKCDKCHFIISSRPEYLADIDSSLKYVTIKLEPLSLKEIKEYILNYLPGESNAQLRQALYDKIKRDNKLQALCKIPLILYLTICVASYRNKQNNLESIPNLRTELYREFISKIQRYAQDNGRIRPNLAREGLTERIISCLAFWMQCENSLILRSADVYRLNTTHISIPLDEIVNIGYQMGFLVKNEDSISIGFHQSFQEYFAAVRLTELYERGVDIAPTFTHLKWKDVVLMTSEMVDESDEFVKNVMSKNPYLAAKCSNRVSDEMKKELTNILLSIIESGAYFKERGFNIYDIASIVDRIPNSESFVPILYEDIDSDLRSSAARALGNIGATEAIPKLIEALSDDDPYVRGSAACALGNIGVAEAIPDLIKAISDEDQYVRDTATYVLGDVGKIEELTYPIEDISDFELYYHDMDTYEPYYSDIATYVLEEIGTPEVIPKIMESLSDDDPSVRRRALSALSNIGTPEVVPKLIEALSDDDPFVRGQAAVKLAKIGTPEVMSKLIEALSDKEANVRASAVRALAKIGTPEVLPKIIEALSDKEANVRASASEQLKYIIRPEAVPKLIEALSDDDPYVRGNAVSALSNIGTPEVVPKIIESLSDKEANVRASAVNALGKIGTPEELPKIMESLSDKEANVRASALRALARIGTPEVVPKLIEALSDDDPFVRGQATCKLGFIGVPEEAVPILIEALSDDDTYVRERAIHVIRFIGAPEAVPKLIEALLDDYYSFLDETVARTLDSIIGQVTIPKLIEVLSDVNIRGQKAVINMHKISSPIEQMEILESLAFHDDYYISKIGYIIIKKFVREQKQKKIIFQNLKMNCN